MHTESSCSTCNRIERGVFEDKYKELVCSEHVVNNMRGVKTVGVIEDDPITESLTKIVEPASYLWSYPYNKPNIYSNF